MTKDRQPKIGEWLIATHRFTKETIKGKFCKYDIEGITLDVGDKLESIPFLHHDFDFLHRDWQEVNHEDVVCRVESSNGFVTFEIRKIKNVYDLYMILGYDGKMLLKEFTDLEKAKEYVEKIIDSMKQIA